MNIKQLLIGASCLFALSACGQQAGQPSSQGLALKNGGNDSTLHALHVGFCVYTQGYYKNHPEAFAMALQRYGTAGPNVTPASVFYPQTQQSMLGTSLSWAEMLKTPPKKGNAYIILAHQYITAVANGLWRNDDAGLYEETEIKVDGKAVVGTAFMRARGFFEGTRPETTRAEMIEWAQIFDNLNNGRYETEDGKYAHCN